MSWAADNIAVVFECDDCGQKQALDIELARHGATGKTQTDFITCWNVVRGIGWVSFKRVNQPWEYFCPGCADAAEKRHAQHKIDEAERERIKSRNS